MKNLFGLFCCIAFLLGHSSSVIGQTISSITPNTGDQGDSFTVTLTGTGTTWSATPCVEIYDGVTTITLTGVNVSSPTLLTGTISIPGGATLGSYDARVYDGAACTGPTDGTCTSCFTVNAPDLITSISPNTGVQGTSFSVTLTGMNTTWSGSPCVEIYDGFTTMTLSSVMATSATSLTGTLNIPGGATVGSYDARVYDDPGGSCSGDLDGVCTSCFTVTTPPPEISSISPNSGDQGDSFTVTLTGVNTTWSATPCVEIYDGMTTITLTSVNVSSPTSLTGTVTIPGGATLGSYDARVYDGAACAGPTDGTCTSCFTVNAPDLITSISPNTGVQGTSFSVTLTGMNTTWSGSPCVEIYDGFTTMTLSSVMATSGTSLTGTLNIPGGATVGSYNARVYDDAGGSCGGDLDGVCTSCFTVTTPPPEITSITPNTGDQGDSFAVTLTGVNTTWSATPCVEIYNGMTTITLTSVNVSSPTSLTGVVTIPGGATLGSYDARVYDGAACMGPTDGTCTSCFTVNAPDLITSISPNTGAQGTSFSVTLTGMNTTWSGSPCVEIYDGFTTMTLSSVMATSATSLTGTLNIPGGATVGSYNARVYDDPGGSCGGDLDGVCTSCFTVTTPPPEISSISPNSGDQGDSFAVTLTGVNTTWSATPCVEIYDGTTTLTLTNVNVSSPTLLTGTVSIPVGATLGSYDARVYDGGACTGPTDGTCTSCFTVTATEVITSISPNTGEQATSFSVTLTGMNTTWSGSPCVEIYDGITTLTLTGVSAVSSTLLTGTITIPPGATTGNYNAVVYDDAGGACSGPTDGTCVDCFTVTAPPGQITSITPNSGDQGDSFTVTLTGMNTTWSGTPCVEVFDGVTTMTLTNVNVSSPTLLVGTIAIPGGANLGSYDARVYDGAACSGPTDGTCTSCFTVTPPPTITMISPNMGVQGSSFAVTLTGINTNWSGSPCVEIYDGMTTLTLSNVMATSATSLGGTVTIPASATVGTYDAVVYEDPGGNCSSDAAGTCTSCFTVTALVPVEWLSFKAISNENSVDLIWEIASEEQSDFYEVQRSADGQNWKVLGELAARGFTHQTVEYNYRDRLPLQGLNYYRIRQVDLDGSAFFSETIVVDRLLTGFDFDLFPNPVLDELKLRMYGAGEEAVGIRIYDLFDQLVYESLNNDPTAPAASIDLADLPGGMYLLTIQQGARKYTKQFIKLTR